MYTKILVLLDGSELAESVLPYVQWFVKVSNVQEVVFLRVVEPFKIPGGIESAMPPEERERIEQDAAQLAKGYLDKVTARFKTHKVKLQSLVLLGKPVKVIAEYVAKSDVDLIIMATHGFSGLHRWVSGSIADEIVHAATVPVFLVTPKDKPPEK